MVGSGIMALRVDNSRRIPIEKAASLDEIEAAITTLTPEQLTALMAFANWRVRGLGYKKAGRDGSDLLQEAITSICSGIRRWDRDKVNFLNLLKGAVRSISDNWRRATDDDEARLETDVVRVSSSGQEINPMLQVTTPALDGRRHQKAKQDLEFIENLLVQRETAALIFMASWDGLSGPEIRAELNLSIREYETEVRWIRRTVKAAFG